MSSVGAHGRLLADLHVGDDFLALQHALDQQFELAAGRLLAEQARLHHLRVVEDQQVAGAQQRGQGVEDAIDRLGAGAVEQARGAAFEGGMLGHQFGRQVEIEIGKGKAAHVLEGRTGPCQVAWEKGEGERAELSHARRQPAPSLAKSPSPPAAPSAQRAGAPGAGRARCSARCASSAWCATSTSRSTCRCATRTRRASCAWPTCATARWRRSRPWSRPARWSIARAAS